MVYIGKCFMYIWKQCVFCCSGLQWSTNIMLVDDIVQIYILVDFLSTCFVNYFVPGLWLSQVFLSSPPLRWVKKARGCWSWVKVLLPSWTKALEKSFPMERRCLLWGMLWAYFKMCLLPSICQRRKGFIFLAPHEGKLIWVSEGNSKNMW